METGNYPKREDPKFQVIAAPDTQQLITWYSARPRQIDGAFRSNYHCAGLSGDVRQIQRVVQMRMGDQDEVGFFNMSVDDGLVGDPDAVLGDGPPYEAGCGGQMTPFNVTLPPGVAIAIPLDLGKYFDWSDSKEYEGSHIPAGK